MHIIAQSVSKGKELILVLFIWREKTARVRWKVASKNCLPYSQLKIV